MKHIHTDKWNYAGAPPAPKVPAKFAGGGNMINQRRINYMNTQNLANDIMVDRMVDRDIADRRIKDVEKQMADVLSSVAAKPVAEEKKFPTWGYVAIGVSVLAVVGGFYYFKMKK